MYDSPQDLLEALRATPIIATTLVQACTDEQGRSARGGDEGWSVVEVLCHLRDAEEEALARMRAMRDQTNPFLAAYDQERWAKERHYAQAQLHNALSAFCHWRAQFIAELAQLRPEQWERPGQHEEVGQITISSQALHIVSHDSIHLAQIARQLHDASV
jgi:hypothetical protein